MSGYAELLCRTNFSFLRGASHARELVAQAAALGHMAIGICDDATLAGMVRAHEAAKAASIKLLVGARFVPPDGPEIALYAMNRRGYANLCRLVTTGRRRAPKGQCHVTLEDVAAFAEDLLAVAIAPPARDARWREPLAEVFAPCREIFGDRAYLALVRHLGDDDACWSERQRALAVECRLPSVAANDVHYHAPERQPLQDVLTCVREGCTIHEAGYRLFANAERYLKPESRMRMLFAGCEDAVDRTIEAASRCAFSLDELRYEYPAEVCPQGVAPAAHFADLTWRGAAGRYPDGVPDNVRAIIVKELALIGELRYEHYFLTVHDLVRFARSRGILCQGRGSAANSAVCFCLGVTSVDPAHHDLLFERFVSKERNEPPDIDIDFENARREEVIQYIYEKYGRERAGLTAVVITYRRRSALREVGKALGLSLDQVDALSKHVDSLSDPAACTARLRDAGLDPEDRTLRLVLRLARELRGFPRHLSQHVGGFVITRERLDELVPVENAAMEGRTVIEWDKDDIDALGMLKVDCLALGMLTALSKCFALVARHYGRELDMAKVLATDLRDPDDPSEPGGEARGVYDMICEADTIGTFQIESRAQMQMLPRLRPRCFYDLVIEVAIVRPGPIQGGMIHPYLRRRDGREVVDYPHESTRPVLEKTLGIPLFQEQVMQLAVVVAGYTPGEADILRKDMAAWKRTGNLERHREKLITGMAARGISPEFSARLFEQIKGFSDYGFPESHAASFALIAYVSCYLKRYYPAAFTAALVNSQPMGFYSVNSLVRDAREHGVDLLPPDVNASAFDCTLASIASGIPDHAPATWGAGGPKLRLGLRCLRGVSEETAARIASERERGGLFCSVENFARRTSLDKAQLAKLARGDAFASLKIERREALWQARAWEALPPLLRELPALDDAAVLPRMGLDEHVLADYEAQGFSLRAHPLALVREKLADMGIVPCRSIREAAEGTLCEIAGIVLCRQRPGTASGVVFMTLEDESGVANVIIWNAVAERHRRAVRLARLLRVRGTIQRDPSGKVINLIAEGLAPLDFAPAAAHTTSHDFH